MTPELQLLNALKALGIRLALDDNANLVIRGDKAKLTQSLIGSIKQLKPQIVALLEQHSSNKQALHISPSEDDTPVGLSFAQQRLWLLDQIDQGSVHYNMPFALNLTGELDITALQRAFNTIVERHHSLRTCIVIDEQDEPVQQLLGLDLFAVQITDLTSINGQQQAAEVARLTQLQANQPFDLAKDVMIRVQLLQLGRQNHRLLLTMHHIASDGQSMQILLSEFNRLYQGQALPALPIQYADYARWQRQWLQGNQLAQQLNYWQQQLADLPLLHSLPLDYPRPKIQGFAGAEFSHSIDSATTEQLNQLCVDHEASLFMGLYSVFSALLSRFSDNDGDADIVIGTPVANREQAQVKDLIGFFVNTLVLRSKVDEKLSLQQLLAQSKQMLQQAYAHQQIPFEQIVERLQPERSLSHSPLFQVLLVLEQEATATTSSASALQISPVASDDIVAKYDLSLNVVQGAQGLTLNWVYNRELFKPQTVALMAESFERLMQQMLQQPSAAIAGLPMLANDYSEKVLALSQLSHEVTDQQHSTLVTCFEQQAIERGDAIALTYDDATANNDSQDKKDQSVQQLSYKALNARANLLAHQLPANRLIGICLQRSLDTVVAILAVLKAGSAYVPLDPDYPASRLNYIIEDADLALVITDSELTATLPQIETLAIDKLTAGNTDNPQVAINADSLAYVIYTSGSTGQPKGVKVTHGNVLRLLSSCQQDFAFDHNDVWTLFHSFAFDFSVWEIWGALAFGGRVVVVPYWVSRSTADFYALVQQQQVTVLNQTPSAFTSFIAQDLTDKAELALRYVIFGGEALNLAALQPWIEHHSLDQVALINMYGITETTVHVTFKALSEENIRSSQGASLIGRPLNDLAVVILNQAQALQPLGVAGEMYVGGAGVTQGYLNRDELTAQRFLQLPFSEQKFYRTGDIGRYRLNHDGGIELEYLGRIDHQVKIRGFRIELGEIQNALIHCDKVDDAFVTTHNDASGQSQILAYVVASQSSGLIDNIRQQLSDKLPSFMVPAAFVVMDTLPLTVNGKVDVKALPAADVSSSQRSYVAPVTTTEKLLAQVWQQLLNVEQVGVNDNFFALGGHSLLVIQVISKMQQHGVELVARDVFANDTLAALAAVIDGDIDASDEYQAPSNLIPADCRQITAEMLPLFEPQQLTQQHIESLATSVGGMANIQDIYPLGPLQQGILFHHVATQDGGGDPYVMPSLFTITGKTQIDTFINAMNFVIARHDILRTCVFWQGLPLPVQLVLRHCEVPLTWLDLAADVDAKAHMQQLCDPSLQRINLTDGPLVKLTITRQPDSEFHVVMLQIHHIVADHITQEVIGHEIELYFREQTASLPAAVPYREFIAHTLHQAKTHDAKGFFTELLADVDEPTAPFGLFDVQGDGGDVDQCVLALNDGLAEQLRQLAQQLNTSPAVLFHAAWALLVGGCSGRDDVVFGTVMSGRLQGTEGAERMPGVFINTLPIRVKFADCSVVELIHRVRDSLQQLIPYEQAILAEAQAASGLPADVPLFSAMLNYRHSVDAAASDDYQADASFNYLGAQERTNYPFLLSVNDLGRGFELDIQVVAGIKASNIFDYMVSILTQMAAQITSQDQQQAAQLSFVSVRELALLQRFNDTAKPYPDNALIHQLIEAQVARTPDAIAVKFAEHSLSYQQLNQQANRLAHWLVNHTERQLVGLCLPRSLEMVVAIVAVLKAGKAYVPLATDLPQQRLDYLVQDADLQLVLTPRLLADSQADVAQCSADEPVIDGLNCRDLAYVIYTSGSTGKPKGVMIEHQALVNRIDWMQQQYGCDHSDNILQKTPYSFDVSVWEFMWPLTAGATVVMAKPDGHQQPDYLTEVIKHEQITKLHFVPSMLSTMLQLGDLSQADGLRQVFSSGEALSIHLQQQFNQHCPQAILHNLYGPTEAAIDVSFYDCSEPVTNCASVPIGQPIQNIEFKVVDQHLKLLPLGVAGQLLIGGVGLARGYLNRDDLTANAFIVDEQGKRWYQTGDLVRWLDDGRLEYLNRLDHQVKIRGFRIELGEIEAALLALDEVVEAVVIADDDHLRLLAYVVLNQSVDEQLSDRLCAQLLQQLPQHMVPAAFVALEQMPVTANGKLDRRRLPAVDGSQLQASFVAPQTEMQCTLANIWQQVLGLEQVGLKDNFFAIGGHSLLVMQVIAELQQLGIEMTVAQIFASRDLADLAEALETAAGQQEFSAPDNLIPANCQQLTPQMLPLVELSEQDIARVVAKVPQGSSNIEDIYPLGPLQQGILFHHMVSPQTDPYVLTSLYRMKGADVFNNFIAALQFVLDRHDVLRTAILWQDLPQAVQVVYRQVPLPVEWLEVPATEDCQQYMQQICDKKEQVMDLTQGPLLRLKVAKAPDSDQHYVIILLHHIIADHVALEVIQQEIIGFYRGETASYQAPVPYREFIAHSLHQAKHNDAPAHFSEMLGDFDATTAPFGLADIQGDGSEIVEYRHRIDDALAAKVRQLAGTMNWSPAVFFHAAYAMVLAACSGRSDVVFGTVLSGRLQGTKGATTMLGVFINTLPIRIWLEDVSAQDLLQQVSQSLYGLLPYEQTSLVVAQQAANLPQDAPLFCALLNFRHSTSDATTEPEHDPDAIFDYLGGQERSNYPLGMLVDDFDTGFLLNVQIHQSIDGQRVADYMSRALSLLTAALEASSNEMVIDWSLLTEQEQHKLTKTWNQTQVVRDYDNRHVCLAQLFEQSVASQPDATAVSCGGESLSFAELNVRANHLARYLHSERKVGADTLVGICFDRSIEMVVALLAVLKAGGAYVPLDPQYPEARLRYMIEDAELATVLTAQKLAHPQLQSADIAVCIDSDEVLTALAAFEQQYQGANLVRADLDANRLAYVIYTSGSSGQPKGVMIEHHSVVNLAYNIEQLGLQSTKTQAWGWSASLSFDASVKGLTQLLLGYPLHVIGDEAKRDPAKLAAELDGLAVIDCTPLVVDAWFAAGLETQLPNLIIGGDAISDKLWQSLVTWQRQFNKIAVNIYGPTECTVDAFSTVIDDSCGRTNIGTLMGNISGFVLDGNQHLAVSGAPGELYLGGVGVARGYLNRPELTAERFIDNPFVDELGDSACCHRLYRTGDKVQWLDNGHMVYLGRIDHQVKIRGFRIELGEIENLLRSHDDVQEAVVVAQADENGDDQRLVAYVVPVAANCDESQLIAWLEQRLPDYMLPSAWQQLDSLPLTPNGKVDRNALPQLEAQQQAQYVAPSTDIETQICQIFQQVLGVERVGVTENFFELGGHSLLVIKLLALLKAKFDVLLQPTLIFEMNDVQSLAAHIAVTTGAVESTDDNDSEEIEMETFEL